MRYGNYNLLKKLAVGGMAEVFLAKQTGLAGFERLVCIKRILPHLAEHDDFISMFLDEARIAAQLNHPNIVQIYELGEIDGSYFIAMEYIHGDDIRHIYNAEVAQGKSMPFEVAAHIIHGACTGLAFAHKKTDTKGLPLGIVHRDVSPQNILVTYDGHIKVVDFGVAKAKGKVNETRSGVLKGKYSYMSPEQAHGQEVDPRSDIFSAGIILYEVTTGTRLFKRENELETLHAVMECNVQTPSTIVHDYPAQLEDILMTALAKDPQDRFQTTDDLVRHLENYLMAAGVSPSPTSLGAYMQELFEEKINEALFSEEEDIEDNFLAGMNNAHSKPSTKVSGPSRSRIRQRESSKGNTEGSGNFYLLESLPTVGYSNSIPDDVSTRIGDSISQSAHDYPDMVQDPISNVIHKISEHKATISIGIAAALVFLVTISFIAVLFNISRTEPQHSSLFENNTQASEKKLKRTSMIHILTIPTNATISFPDLDQQDPAAKEVLAARTNFVLRSGLPMGNPVKTVISRKGYLPKEIFIDPQDDNQIRSGIFVRLERDLSQTAFTPINLQSSPTGATVYIDGESTGQTTPLKGFQVEGGSKHTIDFVLEGYETKSIAMDVPIQEPQAAPFSISVKLNSYSSTSTATSNNTKPKAPIVIDTPKNESNGWLTIKSSVPYHVYLNNKEIGLAPLSKKKMAPGTYKLKLIRKKQNVSQYFTTTIKPGKETTKFIPYGEGTLNVNAIPYALVSVSDLKPQETPTSFKNIIAGEHIVTIQCPNGKRQTKRVTIANGKTKRLTYRCQ